MCSRWAPAPGAPMEQPDDSCGVRPRSIVAAVSPSRTIAIVTQHSPPSSLVGARRPAALAKQLSRRGHRVAILTSVASGTGPVPHAAVTVRTRDLLATPLNWRRGSLEAQQGTREGQYMEASRLEELVVPDVSALSWMPFALPRAVGLVKRLQADCVITTGPPQSAHLAGPPARAAGAAWIADLRDGWSFDPPHAWAGDLLTRADRALETSVLRRADALVAVTEPIAADLRARLSREVATITNGFDPEEDASGDVNGLVRRDRFTIAYTGRLGVAGRRPQALLEGALELRRRRPGMERPPEIVFAGAVAESERDLLSDPRYGDVARTVGVLERPRALALQRAADALVVIAAGSAGHPSSSVATGKLFEYLGARRPVLVLGERTEAARIVAGAGVGVSAPATDAGAVADALARLIDGDADPCGADIDEYSWPVLAARYERIMEDAEAARSR